MEHLVAGIALLALLLSGLAWFKSTSATGAPPGGPVLPSDIRPSPPVEVALDPEPTSQVPAGTVDLDALLRSMDLRAADEPGPLVIALPDDTALVLGKEADALHLGDVLGEAGPRLVSLTRRASAGVQAGVQAGRETGYLVQLHPDSVKALKALKPDQVKDAAGYLYSTLRDGDGKYRHVIRIKDVGSLQALSSGTAVLSALAMQAQLDRIEKQLKEVLSSIDRVRWELDAAADSAARGLDENFAEIYRVAHETGELSRHQWEQIAPNITRTYERRLATIAKINKCIQDIEALPKKAKDRKRRLEELARGLARLLDQLDEDDRRVAQAQGLRLWHLAVTCDPSLASTLDDTRRQVDARLAERQSILTRVVAVVEDLDVAWLQKVHWRARREIRATSTAVAVGATKRRKALEPGPVRDAIETSQAESATEEHDD